MGNQFSQEEIARGLAQKLAENATDHELRRSYEEIMYEQFRSMSKEELLEVLWHGWILKYIDKLMRQELNQSLEIVLFQLLKSSDKTT